MVGHEKGANEEEDAHEEGVRVVVAAGCLHPVHEGVVDVELDDENELFVDILSKQNGIGLCKNTVPLHNMFWQNFKPGSFQMGPFDFQLPKLGQFS